MTCVYVYMCIVYMCNVYIVYMCNVTMCICVLSISFLHLFFYMKICLFLVMLSLSCCMGFSLVAATRDCSLLMVCGLLVMVASPVVDPAVFAACGLSRCGSWAVAHRLSSCGICN